MEECIFCRIIEGQIPSSKVFEDEKVMVIMDINPANKGHVLVMPKKHTADFLSCPEEGIIELMAAAKKTAQAVSNAVGTNDMNIVINNGRHAGQMVDHIHIHIIPRFENDNRWGPWKHTRYKEGEMKSYCEKIGKFI